jgi:SLT domain-containing protein
MRVVASSLPELLAELDARDVQHVERDADIVFLDVADAAGLRGARAAWSRVAEGGAMWIVYPRGSRAVTQNEVLAAGRALGLLDVKVIRFSDTHTALRFVAPRARR